MSAGVPAALIVDYGGVLTGSLEAAMSTWCEADGVDRRQFASVMREWLGDSAGIEARLNPVHALEVGQLAVPEFEQRLAERLRTRDGRPLEPTGLVRRMFAGFAREPSMVGAVRAARDAGVATALLSNSWGLDYPREDWEQLFDAVVISGEVGLRKPDPEIYRLTADRLRVAVEACVFVDDLRPNVRAAAAVGMIGVHHVDAATTIAELEVIFDRPLRPGATEPRCKMEE